MFLLAQLALLPAHATPCPDLAVSVSPPGTQAAGASVAITGAWPNHDVWLYRDGSDDACPPGLAPTCLDMDGVELLSILTPNGSGNATDTLVVPVEVDPSEVSLQVVQPDCDPVGRSEVVTATFASSQACSYMPSDWGQDCADHGIGCIRDTYFDAVYPGGFVSGPISYPDAASLAAGLPTVSEHRLTMIALQLSVDYDRVGAFGYRVALGDEIVPSGPYVGQSADEIVVRGLNTGDVPAALADAARQLLVASNVCPPPMAAGDFPDPEPGDTGTDTGFGDTGADDSGLGDSGVPGEETGAAPWETGGPVDETGAPVDTGSPVDETGAPVDTSSPTVDTGTPVDETGGPAPWDTTLDTGVAGGSGVAPIDTGAPTDETGGPAPWDTSAIDTGTPIGWDSSPLPVDTGSPTDETGGPAPWDTSVGDSGVAPVDTGIPGGTGGPAPWDTSVGDSGVAPVDTGIPGGTGGPAPWDTSVGGSGVAPVDTGLAGGTGGPAPWDTSVGDSGGTLIGWDSSPLPVDTGLPGGTGTPAPWDTSAGGSAVSWLDTAAPGGTGGPAPWDTSVGDSGAVPLPTGLGGTGGPAPWDTSLPAGGSGLGLFDTGTAPVDDTATGTPTTPQGTGGPLDTGSPGGTTPGGTGS